MSLFKSVEKWKRESEESVIIKQKLDAHTLTYPAARADYDKGRPLVIKLTAEVNSVLQAEGRSPGYKQLAAELKEATLKRDKPLQIYGNVKHDLELELSQLNHLFIMDESQRWEDETLKVRSGVVHQAQPKEKDEPGTFSIGGSHKVHSNKKAVRLFQEKSQENQNHLRDMVHSSIPEIEQFIEKAETEMRAIDLTPVEIVMDEKEFQHDRLDSGKEPGKTETGYVPPLGAPFIVNPQAGQGKDSGDDLFRRFDSFKARL